MIGYTITTCGYNMSMPWSGSNVFTEVFQTISDAQIWISRKSEREKALLYKALYDDGMRIDRVQFWITK